MRIVWTVLIIIAIIIVVMWIDPIYIIKDIIEYIKEAKEKKEAVKRSMNVEKMPLVYGEYEFWSSDGKVKVHFPSMIKSVSCSIQRIRKLSELRSTLEAENVIKRIEAFISSIEHKVKDVDYNTFLSGNPNELPNAKKTIYDRIITAERACNALASAFTELEVNNKQD